MKRAGSDYKEEYFMGTLIVLAVVVGLVTLIVKSMIRDKKNGKSVQCGADCKSCGGHCSHVS